MKEYNENSTVTMRYEEVELTNNQVTMTFKGVDIEQRGALIFKLFRNRSMGEFVEIYKSEKKKNVK